MKKIFLIFFLTLLVSACGGSSSSDEPEEEREELDISTISETITVNETGTVDLIISGTGNTVNVRSNIGKLSVSGSNNLVNVAANITIESCTVSGSDNFAAVDESVSLVCNDTGAGNIGF